MISRKNVDDRSVRAYDRLFQPTNSRSKKKFWRIFWPNKLIKITFDRISTAKIGQNQDFDQHNQAFKFLKTLLGSFWPMIFWLKSIRNPNCDSDQDWGLALKALEEDDSGLDEEDVAMFTRKFKKLFKKAKENYKKKNFSKARNSDWEQFSGCLKCGKHDHIVKNCPLLKGEHEQK